MRKALVVLVCLLITLGPVAADEKDEEPRKPAKEVAEAEREAALERAKTLCERVGALYREGMYGEAEPLAKEALTLREKILGPDHPDVAQALLNLGAQLKGQGRYEKAKPLYERALSIWEKALGPEHPQLALPLNNLGRLLRRMGHYEQARPVFERMLALVVQSLGPDHLDVALSLNNLAGLLQDAAQYEEARPRFERALGITERVLGPDHPDVAMILNNLALVLKEQGAYEEARPLYERALEIYEKSLGSSHHKVATCLNNLAALLKAQGAYKEALPLYERALEIYEKALGPNHPSVALTLGNLAVLLEATGLYERARLSLERSLSIREKALGPSHPGVAESLNSLGELRRITGQHERALALFGRALRLYEKAFGPDHPKVAITLNNLALLLHAMGQYRQARVLFQRSLSIREKALGPLHPTVALGLNNLARSLQYAKQYNEARPLMERCLDIVEQNVRSGLAGLQVSQRLALTRSLRWYLNGWLELARHLGGSGYAETLRFKGLVARAGAAESRLARMGGSTATPRVNAVRAAERRLARIANAMPPMFLKKRRAEWQRAYANAAAKRAELVLALTRDFDPLRQGVERLDLRTRHIQARLENGAVLLDFLRSGDRYLAWIVRPQSEPERVDLGKAQEIERATSVFVAASVDSDTSEWNQAGMALRDLVFSPIAKRLSRSVKTIYFCPDAALAAVPFSALPGREGRLLIDDYLISTVSMAQELVPWKDAAEPGHGALLLGGVDYGQASVGEGEARAERTFTDRAPRGRRFTYLPGTQAEAELIRTGLGEGTSVLLGKEATENRLRLGSGGKRVLHLATHGFVRGDLMRGLARPKQDREWLGAGLERQLAQGHDPMLLAGLAMAGANTRKGGGQDDGIFTALEASHLDLDGVELVVLSACQTALGKAESGEGVIGLVRGFQMAGAKRVIGSLWIVDDAATHALMIKFYELWNPKDGKEGLGAAAALRKAQVFIRDHRDKHGRRHWKHPYYWAAWVLWGLRDRAT